MTEDRPTILVVDDEADIRRLLQRLLEFSGFEVVVAESGTEALKILDEQEISLVLLDIRMPGTDGIQTLSLMREFCDTPVIMVTGMTDLESLQDALGLGADDYVTKPFSRELLVARIKTKLRRAKPSNPGQQGEQPQ